MESDAKRSLIRIALPRAALFAFLWWVLTGGVSSSWLLGAPAVVLATGVSLALAPATRLRVSALPAFLLRFLLRSVAGGLDVARRALLPGQRLAPAILDYRTTLPDGLPRVFFVNSLSLTPGTLGADLSEDRVRVHVLDATADHARSLGELEDAVKRVFPAP